MSAQTQGLSVLTMIQRAANTCHAHGLTASADNLVEAHTAVDELIATQRDTLKMLEAAHRQLGMWTGDNKRIERAKKAIARVGGAP